MKKCWRNNTHTSVAWNSFASLLILSYLWRWLHANVIIIKPDLLSVTMAARKCLLFNTWSNFSTPLMINICPCQAPARSAVPTIFSTLSATGFWVTRWDPCDAPFQFYCYIIIIYLNTVLLLYHYHIPQHQKSVLGPAFNLPEPYARDFCT